MELWIPYGETEVPVRVPDDNFYRMLEPSRLAKPRDTTALIEEALNRPVGDISLENMVKPGTVAGIIVDPIVPAATRQQSISALRSRLASLGVSETRIFLRKRLSPVSLPQDSKEEDSFKLLDPSHGSFTGIGKTSLGTSVNLEQEVLSCGIKISVSMVQPHFASGFTGGPETVLPGSSSIQSIAANRSLLTKGFPPPLGTGENLVLKDSLEAAKLAGPFFSLAFVPAGWGDVDTALAGDLETVFREAVSRYLHVHGSKMDRRVDIAIVSAGPLKGMDLYHAVRVLGNALNAVKRDGTIILIAECSLGVGDSNFLDYARRFPERKELATELRYRFKLGGHVSLFLQDIREKHRVQLVSVLPDIYARDSFGLKPSRTASEAVQKAVRAEGKESKILIVSRGDLTIPVMEAL